MAQTALNLNLESRTLRPWRGLQDIQTGLTTGTPSTIYRFGLDLLSDTQYWFNFTSKDVDLVKGPLVADQTERTIYTGDGAPKWTNNTLALTAPPYPAAYRDLGVPAPSTAPTVSVTGTGSGTEETRVYLYTNVTTYGEESAPSPASAEVTVAASGHTVTITGFATAPTGNSSTVARRIYRSVTSATGVTNYYFIKELPNGTSSTTDDVGDAIGEPIETSDWLLPPSTMFGITAMANGVLVGFDQNDVCISVAYVPYAWPLAYRLSTDYPIVGGKAIGNQVVVLTTGNPYLLSGVAPESMTLTKLEWPQACVSKRSIVNVGGAVVFASPDGLCAVDGAGQLTNLTEALFSRDDWQALNPESMHGYVHNGRYVGFYDTGVIQGGFVFEPRQGDAAFSYIDTYATAGYADLIQDELFLKVTTKIQKWNATGAYSNYTWLSGVSTLERPENLGVAMVRADAYPVTFKLYADEVLKHTQSVSNNLPFRLPSGYKAAQYEVEISGANEVYEVLVASTPTELKAK
jgi:hypothetical protein